MYESWSPRSLNRNGKPAQKCFLCGKSPCQCQSARLPEPGATVCVVCNRAGARDCFVAVISIVPEGTILAITLRHHGENARAQAKETGKRWAAKQGYHVTD